MKNNKTSTVNIFNGKILKIFLIKSEGDNGGPNITSLQCCTGSPSWETSQEKKKKAK